MPTHGEYVVNVRTSSASVAYTAPFAAFLVFLALDRALGLPPSVMYPIRVVVTTAVLVLVSRRVIRLRPTAPVTSIACGLAVFLIWIGPDLLWPAYRSHWLFVNSITGTLRFDAPTALKSDLFFLFFRVAGSAVLVPIIEELFWRAWLMRWLIRPDFENVALGAFRLSAFCLTAVLFASEHGPYWDVGLAAGIAYNWWMVRTRSLADCILAHAITNGALAAYVLTQDKWQYWL